MKTGVAGLGASSGPMAVRSALGQGGSLEIVISGDAGVPQVFMDFIGNGVLVPVPLLTATGALFLATPTTPLLPGTYRVYFDIPAGTMGQDKKIPTLVRLSSAGGLGVTDQVPAPDGEVEAYIFTFQPTAVSVAAFSGRPAANLPVIGGVAALGAVLAGWGIRRRKAALR